MIPRINFIGAGSLGQTIGNLIVKNNAGKIEGIVNTSLATTQLAQTFIGEGQICSSIESLPEADITFITTPDDLIKPSGLSLSRNNHLKPECIIVHCSGTLASDVLISSEMKNKYYVASIHPMRSFSNPAVSVEAYDGTYCAMEGDEKALEKLIPLMHKIGSITFNISREFKNFYHAAGVFASNYLITLANISQHCLLKAGVDESLSLKIIMNLMSGTLSNIKKNKSLKKSLTGPIKRGDINTVNKHLNELSKSPNIENLYRFLGVETIPIANLPEQEEDRLKNILTEKKTTSLQLKAKL